MAAHTCHTCRSRGSAAGSAAMLDDIRQMFAWSGMGAAELDDAVKKRGWKLELWEDDGLSVITDGPLIVASFRPLDASVADVQLVLDSLGVRNGMVHYNVYKVLGDTAKNNFFAYIWLVFAGDASQLDRMSMLLKSPVDGTPYVPRCTCFLDAVPNCPDPSYDFVHAMMHFIFECMQA